MGEKDDYDSENSWISDGLPSSSRRRRRGGEHEKKNVISGPETGVCRFFYSRSQSLSVGIFAFQGSQPRKHQGSVWLG